MRIDLLRVADARYEPPPWYSWVLLDVDADTPLGYFKRREDAEREMTLWLAEDDG